MEAFPHPKPLHCGFHARLGPFADTEGRALCSHRRPGKGWQQHAALGRRGPGRGGGAAPGGPGDPGRTPSPAGLGDRGVVPGTENGGSDNVAFGEGEVFGVCTPHPSLQPRCNTQGRPPGQGVPSPPRQPGQPRFRPIKSGNETIRQLAPGASRRQPPSVRLHEVARGRGERPPPRLPASVARAGFGDSGSKGRLAWAGTPGAVDEARATTSADLAVALTSERKEKRSRENYQRKGHPGESARSGPRRHLRAPPAVLGH